MKKHYHIFSLLFFALFVAQGFCSEKQGTKITEKRLAEHETTATFKGVKFTRCMGRTGACPDKCGNSGEVVTFEVVNYTRFKSNSKYGKKQKSYRVMLKSLVAKKEFLKTIKSLKEGDKVTLCWNHDVINGRPSRNISKLEKLENP